MTPNQQKVFDAIKNFVAQNGYPPTYPELCRSTGFRSTQSIRHYVQQLEEAGLVTWEPRKTRALRSIGEPAC